MAEEFLRRLALRYLEEALRVSQPRRSGGSKTGGRRPRSRGRWAERAFAAYLRRRGCAALTNVRDVREIDVLGICREGERLVVLVVEVKSGRQLIDTPVLRRLRYIVERLESRKTPLVRPRGWLAGGVSYLPVLVVGPRCGLSPQAVEYAARHGVTVLRYRTRPQYSLEKVV